MLYSVYTSDRISTHHTNTIIKFVDETSGTNFKQQWNKIQRENSQTDWCMDNNFSLNIKKTKELIIDFRKLGRDHFPLPIRWGEVKRVDNFKFLGTYISENLTWTVNTSAMVKNAQQRLYFLRTLKKEKPVFRAAWFSQSVESVLTYCLTAWYANCTEANCKSLQRVIKTAEIAGLTQNDFFHYILSMFYHMQDTARAHVCHHIICRLNVTSYLFFFCGVFLFILVLATATFAIPFTAVTPVLLKVWRANSLAWHSLSASSLS